MFDNLQVFRMASAMATHAGKRQSVIARNMANADTPGYKAQDIEPYQAKSETDFANFSMRATRLSHLNAADKMLLAAVQERPGAEADPNGNSVSIESEMLHAVDTKRQHDRALAIYRFSLGILRNAIGKR